MKTTLIKLAAIATICTQVALQSFAQNTKTTTLKGVELNEKSVIKVTVSKQTNGVKNEKEKTFYGKSLNEVNAFLKENNVNAVYATVSKEEFMKCKEAPESKTGTKKITKTVTVEVNDSTNSTSQNFEEYMEKTKACFEMNNNDFEKQTMSMYKDYEKLDKTDVKIEQFEKDGSVLKNICSQHTISIESDKAVCKNASSAAATPKGEKNNFMLDVFPNPAKGNINIGFEIAEKQNITVRIADINGKEVYTNTLPSFSGKHNGTIDLSTISKGTYTLTIQGEKSEIIGSKKFILE